MNIVYPDYNCFQRQFDDATQVRVQFEALACEELFLWAAEGRIGLVWSYIHQDEADLCPVPERRAGALSLAALCATHVGPEDQIADLALELQQQVGAATRDALHLACAAYAGVARFVTCDDRLRRQAGRLRLPFTTVSPVDYVQEVLALWMPPGE